MPGMTMDAPGAAASPSNTEDLNSVRLIEQLAAVASGDSAALGAVYDATVSRVYGLALRITRSAATAEDVVAEVYLQAWQEAARYDPGRGTPSVWLLTICRSRALDALRRADKAESHADPELLRSNEDTADDPFNLLSALDRDSEIHKALQSLDAVQRQMIALAFFKGYTHAEIAQHVAMPLGTVKTHLRKALKHLERAMTDINYER